MSTPEQRQKMAHRIVQFEARRKNGHIAVYELPSGDGGGTYEVAGINNRYHPEQARHLKQLIEAGQYEQAEREAAHYIVEYTDPVSTWTQVAALEFYLRDAYFNRGPGGAAKILQKALGVKVDGGVGPITLGALAEAEIRPAELLQRLRTSREWYEREIVKRDETSPFWTGLVNRWNNALTFAQSYLE